MYIPTSNCVWVGVGGCGCVGVWVCGCVSVCVYIHAGGTACVEHVAFAQPRVHLPGSKKNYKKMPMTIFFLQSRVHLPGVCVLACVRVYLETKKKT